MSEETQERVAIGGARRDHVDRRLGDLRLHPRARRHVRDPEISPTRPAPGRSRSRRSSSTRSATTTAKVMLFITVGAQLYCGMSSITVGLANDVRVLARRRDAGPPALASAEPRARAVYRGRGDRDARVPLRVPGVLRDERVRRLRRGDVDRDDRPVHRLRDPDLPAPPARRLVGAGRVEPRSPLQGGSATVACLWVAFISILFIAADRARRDPVATSKFTWTGWSTTRRSPSCGTLLLVGGWWLISAHEVVQGPDRQGSEEELARIEARYEHGVGRDTAARRRRIVSIPDRREPASGRLPPRRRQEPVLTLEELRADSSIDTVIMAFTDMQGRLLGKRAAPRLLLRAGRARTRHRGLQLPARARDGDGPGAGLRDRVAGSAATATSSWCPTCRRCGGSHGSRRPRSSCATSTGPTALPSVPRRGRCCARRSSGRGRSASSAMVGSELEFYLLKETYEEAHAQHYRDLTPSVPYILDYHILASTYDEPLLRQIRNGMVGAGMRVETSKGEAWPGQHEINFRYADALRDGRRPRRLQERRQGDRAPERLLGHVHGEARPHLDRLVLPHPLVALARRRERLRGRERRSFQQYLAGQIACARELALFFAPNVNSYKRFAAGLVGADDARLGPRQPHVRVPRRRARRRAAGRDADSRAATSTRISPSPR